MKGLFTVLESIKVQNDVEFKEDLVNTCTMLLASYRKYAHYAGSKLNIKIDTEFAKLNIDHKSDMYSSAEYDYLNNLETLRNLLKDRFNLLNLSVISADDFGGGISILLPRGVNFFNKPLPYQPDMVEVFGDSAIGSINLKTAKLSGDISNLSAIIIFNLDFLINYLDIAGAELAAALLHEIGHLFIQLEQSYKITVANNLLNEISIDKDIKNNPDKIRLIMIDSIKVLDSQYVDNNSSMPVLCISLFKKIIKSSQLASYTYSYYQEEEKLADLFAVRFGLGLDFARWEKRIDKYSETTSVKYQGVFLEVEMANYYSKVIRNVFLILSGLITLGLIGGVVLITTFLPIIGIVYPITLFLVIGSAFNNGSINANDPHPASYERIELIKKELIRQLKVLDKYEDSAVIKRMVEEIDELDSLYKSSLNKSLANGKLIQSKILSLLESDKYKRLDETQIEKILENLTNSDIYTDSAKLKLLGE